MKDKKKAFVFTMDAFLMLPLVILIITSLISLSLTVKENILMHEYAYLTARDTMTFLSELKSKGDPTISVLQMVGKYCLQGDFSEASTKIENEVQLSPTVGYIFECDVGKGWEEIKSKPKDNYKFHVSDIRVVTLIEGARIDGMEVSKYQEYFEQFPLGEENITACLSPTSHYSPGKIFGPVRIRMRVFV